MNRRILALLLGLLMVMGLLAGCGRIEAASTGVPYLEDNLQLVEDADEDVQAFQNAEQQRLDSILEALGDTLTEEEAPGVTLSEEDRQQVVEAAREEMIAYLQEQGDVEDPEAAVDAALAEVLGEDAPATAAPALPEPTGPPAQAEAPELTVTEDGVYTSPEEVALYIHTYGHLPDNFITKNEAKDLGWDSGRGNLQDVAPGKSIGGDRFGNYEGLLPKGNYKECDVNYSGGFRGAERLIYGTDGSVYYTSDHYQTFTQLY